MALQACLSLKCPTSLLPQRGFFFYLASHDTVKSSKSFQTKLQFLFLSAQNWLQERHCNHFTEEGKKQDQKSMFALKINDGINLLTVM